MGRKEEICKILEDAGAHPVQVLLTLEGYDYGMSPFELFILNGDKIHHRTLLGNCCIGLSDNLDGTHQFTVIGSEFNAKVSSENEDNNHIMTNFASIINKKEFYKKWHNLWNSTILSEFTSLLRDWHMWKQVPFWGKYIAFSIISFREPTTLEKNIGQAVGKSLFTSLDSFLIEPFLKIKTQEKLRCGRWEDGITPSLHTLVEVLENIETGKIHVSQGWMNSTPFSDKQSESLCKIKCDLKKYTKPNRFWDKLANHSNFDEKDRNKNLDLLFEMVDEKMLAENRKEEILTTYIRTARNAMAHNRDTLDLEEQYLIRIGYNGMEERLVEQTLETIFDFLTRIYTEVFGLDKQDLLDWKNDVDREAESIGEDFYKKLVQSEFETQFAEQHDKNRQWRFSTPNLVNEHVCSLPKWYSPRLDLLFNQPFITACQECSGLMHIIYLEEPNHIIDVEVITDSREKWLNGQPDKIVMVEGTYGTTTIHVEYPEAGNEVIISEQEEKTTLRLLYNGETLWEGDCIRDKLTFPGQMNCATVQPFQLPFQRYQEIKKRKEEEKTNPE